MLKKLSSKTVQERIAVKKQAIKDLQEEIKGLQERCDHKWQTLGTSNDSDGWSINVDITWYTEYRCEICGKQKTTKLVSKY